MQQVRQMVTTIATIEVIQCLNAYKCMKGLTNGEEYLIIGVVLKVGEWR